MMKSYFCQLAFVAACFFQSLCWAQTSSPTGPTHPNIAPNCNAFHTVVEGDGCWSVETFYGITHANFILWNPDVSDDCLSNFWRDSSYCVGVGAVVSSSRTSSSTTISSTTSSSRISTTIATTTTSRVTSTVSVNATYSIREPIVTWDLTTTTAESAFPPQKTQVGQTSHCINWHLVIAGETCKDIVGGATWTSMEEFLQWNPAVGSDCTGLFDGWWVCIAIQPQSVTVTFDYTLTALPGTTPDPTSHVSTTLTPADTTFVPSPTQAGLAADCETFYLAKDGDTCRQVLQYGLVSQEQFFAWNPALNSNCDGLWLDTYYCVGAGTFQPAPPTVTIRPTSIPQGQISTCVKWYQVDDSETCDEIVVIFGRFSKADFITWNPSVGSTCGDIVSEQFLCVGIPSTPTTRTAAAPTTSFPTQPTQIGLASDCSELWLVSSTDSCSSIAKGKGISVDQLLIWNPALGTSTCTLTQDFYICVKAIPTIVTSTRPSTTSGPATTSAVSTTRSSTTTSSTTTSAAGAIITPSPIQAGMVAGCRRFYFAQLNDGCWAIANSAGIELNNFYAWNPAVGNDCAGLWLDTFYCIGIAGPTTTITSGPPVPT